ncbi:2-dehydropantoate 2-reductase [Shimazuella sp. AN120528]|uniref:ketopantoate reductase family protein n=1 Tax=Shimazuella soli TaxID=1892854 RepID=UPI001F0D976E|nr:2-dehydropantoate 2-reductase [Shimazuella soli]MCH5584030.1 2-dehydropantoate 2-reductase [Shimazuella soli]
MKIGIIGGGSLGLLWATRMSEYADVTLICKSEQQAEVIRRDGVILTTLNGQKIRYRVTAEWIDEFNHSAGFDVLFLMTKQPALNRVLSIIPSFTHEQTHVIAWQNGLGHVEKLRACSYSNSYAVVTTEGARKISVNHVHHTGNGYVRIGSVNQIQEDAIDPLFLSLMQSIGIQWVEDIERYMWQKFAINVVINPLTALLEIPNGKLMEIETQTIIKQLIKELCLVADAKGFYLNQTEIYQQVSEVCFMTSKNLSSMLQDIRNKRQTEIDSLNGIVVSYADQLRLAVPTHIALTELIKAKSMLF